MREGVHELECRLCTRLQFPKLNSESVLDMVNSGAEVTFRLKVPEDRATVEPSQPLNSKRKSLLL